MEKDFKGVKKGRMWISRGARVAQAEGIDIAKVLGQNRSLNYSFRQKEVSVAEAVGVRGTSETDPGLGREVFFGYHEDFGPSLE